MDEQKDQIVDVIKQANNILVTVKSDPTIDQLAACIALTLMINELGKHGTAVFSGKVPSVLEFLEPEKTIERNTDSLQDFIISLDKSKADKLRYKIEDTVVKIFITPYRTSISDKDLEFGQGDFNVDAVIALGVHSQDDLDQAITAHGRILHDATVTCINTVAGVSEDLGSINWVDEHASSLSEMVAGLAEDLGKEGLVDNQVATALLTGIVAETERFGNAKTSPHTMEVSAQLLTAGANQELVATKLSEPHHETHHDNHINDGPSAGADSGASYIEPLTGDNDPNMLEIEHPVDEAHEDAATGTGLESAASALNVSTEVPAAESAPVDTPLLDTLTNEAAAPAPEPEAEPVQPDVPAVETPQAPEAAPVEPAAEVAPPAPAPEPVAPEAPAPAEDQSKAEEAAALDLINQRKVVLDNRARIQPLREQGEFLGEAPKVAQKDLKPAGEEEKAAADLLQSTKFALTPPTLGAALNATEKKEAVDEPTAALAATPDSTAPLLAHHAPGLVAADGTGSEPATPPVSPAVTPQYQPDTAAPAPDAPLIAPAFDMAAAPSAKPAEGASLADLEKRVAGGAAPAPEEHLIDMPLPAAAASPAPAPVAPAAPAATPLSPAAPPPVPPPMMPPAAA